MPSDCRPYWVPQLVFRLGYEHEDQAEPISAPDLTSNRRKSGRHGDGKQRRAVRSWHAALLPMVPTAATSVYQVLRSLNTAVTDGVLVTNPCKVQGAGQVGRPKDSRPCDRPPPEAIVLPVCRIPTPRRGDAGAVTAPELETASVAHARMELTLFGNSDLAVEHDQLDIFVVLGSLARISRKTEGPAESDAAEGEGHGR
jgi:hypothetical protein